MTFDWLFGLITDTQNLSFPTVLCIRNTFWIVFTRCFLRPLKRHTLLSGASREEPADCASPLHLVLKKNEEQRSRRRRAGTARRLAVCALTPNY